MKVLRVYIDTSVIGGNFDPEFAEWSRGLLNDARKNLMILAVSELTDAEIKPAPVHIRELYRELLQLQIKVIPVSEEALSLLSSYEAHQILSNRYRNDMLHIALATVANVDVLVSWNFRHIVRLDKIRQFNAVNLEQGYKQLAIYSPREVAGYGKEDDDRGLLSGSGGFVTSKLRSLKESQSRK